MVYAALAGLIIFSKEIRAKNRREIISRWDHHQFNWHFYGFAVEQLPASIAIVLLFQFTWIGVILEAVVDRKLPSREKVISMVILLIGTVLAGASLSRV